MMGQPHKHAELIKAWADGVDVEQKVFKINAPSSGGVSLSPDFWADFDGKWRDDMEYRIKPEPPKCPQTKMSDAELQYHMPVCTYEFTSYVRRVADVAIARAIEDGDVVPAAMLEAVAKEVQKAYTQVRGCGGGGGTSSGPGGGGPGMWVNGTWVAAGGSGGGSGMGVPVIGADITAIIKRVKEGK